MSTPAIETDDIWAVLPAKSFTRGKSRLRDALDDHARALLAQAMFTHVLGVTQACARLAGTLVITDGDDVAEVASRAGALVMRDPTTKLSLAGVIDTALTHLQRRGARAALVLMTDLPEATSADIDAILAALADAELVLAADSSGHHTNALALRLGHGYTTCFGAAHSLADHTQRAHQLGLRVLRIKSAGLAFDVDTPSDLARSATGQQLSAVPEPRNA